MVRIRERKSKRNLIFPNRRAKQEQSMLAYYALQEGGRPKVNVSNLEAKASECEVGGFYLRGHEQEDGGLAIRRESSGNTTAKGREFIVSAETLPRLSPYYAMFSVHRPTSTDHRFRMQCYLFSPRGKLLSR